MLSLQKERCDGMCLSQMGIFTKEEIARLREKISETAVPGETEVDRQQRAFHLLTDAVLIRGFASNENAKAVGPSNEETDRSPAT